MLVLIDVTLWAMLTYSAVTVISAALMKWTYPTAQGGGVLLDGIQ